MTDATELHARAIIKEPTRVQPAVARDPLVSPELEMVSQFPSERPVARLVSTREKQALDRLTSFEVPDEPPRCKCGAVRDGKDHCTPCHRKKYEEFNETKLRERHPNSRRFHELLAELGDLHDLKQADYGRGDDPFANVRSSEEWGVPGWVGAMVRAGDKIRRLQALRRNGKLENESAEDSLRDLAVYSVIALVLFEQARANTP